MIDSRRGAAIKRSTLKADRDRRASRLGQATEALPTSSEGRNLTVFDMESRDLYDAVLSRDRRFDGRMFVGVRSTRIYCRPICTVRAPRFENCTFYRTAACAEAAGFRPCLRCRPELAPGSASTAPVDAVHRLATFAIRRIEDGALSELSLDELAAEFGVTSRHLRRAIRQEAGLTPVELAQTQRLLMAKQLLTDTQMNVTDVAFAAGFESLRRFNAAFKERYRLTPTSLRRNANVIQFDNEAAYNFHLSVRPPFDLARLMAFWETRATSGVEQVSDGCYRRSVVIGNRVGWIAIGSGKPPQADGMGLSPHGQKELLMNVRSQIHQVKEDSVHVVISTSLGPVLPSVLLRLKSMLDVRADPTAIFERLGDDPILAPLFARWPGPRVPGAFDGFECGIRAILGQQISVRAATTLAGRIASRFGKECSTPFSGLTTAFPTPESMAAASITDLRLLGLTCRRAETVKGFATALAEGKIRLEPGADPDRVRAGLLALPGIGEWTAEYLLLRAVSWPDAFPTSDLGLLKASGLSPSELRARAERWRPWRSYAAILLWQSLIQ